MRNEGGPLPIRVKLTMSEILLATLIGVFRQTQDVKKGLRDAHGHDPLNGWDTHIVGALGECGVAKWRNIFWSGNIGAFYVPDVGRVDVRATEHANGRGILHEKDPDDRVFIFVRGTLPVLELLGWLDGKSGKNEEWWEDPTKRNRWAFFVPVHAMRSLESLRVTTVMGGIDAE